MFIIKRSCVTNLDLWERGGDTGQANLNRVLETFAKQLYHWHIGSFPINSVKKREPWLLVEEPRTATTAWHLLLMLAPHCCGMASHSLSSRVFSLSRRNLSDNSSHTHCILLEPSSPVFCCQCLNATIQTFVWYIENLPVTWCLRRSNHSSGFFWPLARVKENEKLVLKDSS